MRKSVDFDSFDWGQITERDKRLIDQGWRQFWLKRGHFPAWDDLRLSKLNKNTHRGNKIDKV